MGWSVCQESVSWLIGLSVGRSVCQLISGLVGLSVGRFAGW